jgi:hypothetical protein
VPCVGAKRSPVRLSRLAWCQGLVGPACPAQCRVKLMCLFMYCSSALQVHSEHMRNLRRGPLRGPGLAVKQHCSEVLSPAVQQAMWQLPRWQLTIDGSWGAVRAMQG